ncbi:limonene-1,2-epoxide hydrolase family protein [Nocardia terpenica]|uniref:Limonene-1,2-epoxide hydrolase domain-containing protein n=1 Tax=Nocardia terpenica TaxID=455432 RepID=A0A291RNB2_9NOCA|nr:limonene-1,2-epoxide hydrolase family protein [Nocardia terpenica]ATL68674.1 hypothetical protein CRH09_23295 [Nocardia terpenica]
MFWPEAIADNIASFIRAGPPGIMDIDFRIINIAANGPIVMTERVDIFTLPGRTFELQVMGIFELRDGRISAWRDYFDLQQFTSRMGWLHSTTQPRVAALQGVREHANSRAERTTDAPALFGVGDVRPSVQELTGRW